MSRWTAKKGSYRRRGTSSPPFHRDYCDDTLMESVTTGEARIGDRGRCCCFPGAMEQAPRHEAADARRQQQSKVCALQHCNKRH
jgi:hypothetical protein